MKLRKSIGLGDLASLTITFVVIAIVIGLGATILQGVDDTTCGTLVNSTGGSAGTLGYCSKNGLAANQTAHTALSSGLGAVGTFSNFLGTIAIIVIAAVIIGIVLTQFVFTA